MNDDDDDFNCCSSYFYARYAQENTLIDLSMSNQYHAKKQEDVLLSNADQSLLPKFDLTWIRFFSVVFSIIMYSLIVIYFYNYLFIQSNCSSNLALFKNETIIKEKHLSKNAFFSILHTDDYFLNTLILGYTIRKYHPNHPMFLLYSDNKLQNQTIRCALQTIGWTLMSIQQISSSIPIKLILWNMTQFDSIVYLDSNTIVWNDLSHLHELVAKPDRTDFEYAATIDNWSGRDRFKLNTGVLVLHPSTLIYNQLVHTYATPNNNDKTIDEEVFRFRYLQLPKIYNVHTDWKPYLWGKLRPDFKIIHFDIQKVFRMNDTKIQGYELYNQLYKDFQLNENVFNIRTVCNIIV